MVKIIILSLITLIYIWNMILLIVESKTNNPIPKNVSDIYNEEEFNRWKKYHSEHVKLDIIRKSVNFVIDFLLIMFNVYALLSNGIKNVYFQAIITILLISASTIITDIFFDYISTMKIEEKYGFNKTTKKTFILDEIKSFIILNAIIIGLTLLYIFLHQLTGDYILVVFAAVLIIFITFILVISPYLGKIDNNFTLLEDGELKEKLTQLLNKYGYTVRGIYIMDASKRTTKSNAYFTGIGKTKTIVLYDNLINSSTPDEICAVFAHEMGHGLNKDTLKMNIQSIFMMIIMAAILYLNVKLIAIYTNLGFNSLNYGFAVYLLMNVEFPLISPIIQLIRNRLSFAAEYKADKQAVKEGYGVALISALKKLTKENFGNLAPSKFIEFFEYDHPTLSQRITAINAYLNDDK